ncbi:hypothetical protein ACFVJ5_28900 [Nocardia sp. NPDC127606]|uniref:hypothetical protein n=1 Tax=Nocardia sp. NPDC127606 TaxID=3345406 RepID=UPI00362C728C
MTTLGGTRLDVAGIRRRLTTCPAGRPGWQEYENVGVEALTYLLVPPLSRPQIQAKTLSGIDRRDAIFPNRITDSRSPWGLLYTELKARLILVEFKNYDRIEIGKEEVDQTRNYMKKTMGRLAIVCCNKSPSDAALRRRNIAFSDEGKVILFLTTAHMLEMIDMKERGEDPSEFIIDSYETFLIQHE